MVLFAGEIKNKSELETWREKLGIKVNPNLRIEKTKERGIGVFYTCETHNESSERIELMRIPHTSSYNIYTLRKLVDENLSAEDKAIVKRTLSVIFARSRGSSESLILIAYFIGFLIVSKKRNADSYRNSETDEFKQTMGTYLSVLLDTTISNLYGDHPDILEDFLSAFPGNVVLKNSIVDITSGLWDEITDTLNEEFLEKDEAMKVEEVLQLCGAIRSRVLEIPREVEGDQEDYYVDVTLVPILDYANHDNEKRNAYFDVDRKSQEVVLYFEPNKVASERDQCEIFISYDEYEDLHRMFVNYGFFPLNKERRTVIEIPIIGYCESKLMSDFEITRRLYCIRQTPNVQFEVLFDAKGGVKSVKVLDDEFYSYLAFKDDLPWNQYEKEDDEAMNELNELNEGKKGGEVDMETEMELDFARGFQRSVAIESSLSGEETSRLMKILWDYVCEFFVKFSAKCRLFNEIIAEYEFAGNEGRNIVKLLDLYIAVCDHVLGKGGEADRILDAGSVFGKRSKDRSSRNKTASGEDADEEDLQGFLASRMVPVYNYSASADGVEIGELEI